MKKNEFLNNRRKVARRKLDDHRVLGNRSNLSIHDVAQLYDIINCSESLVPESEDRFFFGLHSLN